MTPIITTMTPSAAVLIAPKRLCHSLLSCRDQLFKRYRLQ